MYKFSFANRGGNGDIADGIIDVYKFLEVVEYMKPKYWAMENVPRVAGILEREILKGGALEKFAHLFEGDFRIVKVYNSADYGVPQSRKRMIAGKFPHKLFESYQEVTPERTLRDVIYGLKGKDVLDPVYGHRIETLTDNIGEMSLTSEEKRINSDSKTHHPVYNKMSFPDLLDRPSRTVTALCTRVSRESIVVEDAPDQFRRLTVRERGCIQTFPADYQFYSNSYGGKLKMIGNAIPPLLTYYIAQSMLGTSIEKLSPAVSKGMIIDNTRNLPRIFEPDNRGSKYSWSRSFWLAIPNLRLGSGVRFELRNIANKELEQIFWKVNFFFGNSKKIEELPLDKQLFQELWEALQVIEVKGLEGALLRLQEFIQNLEINDLQENWTHKNRSKNGPIRLIDRLGDFANEVIGILKDSDQAIQDQLNSFTDHGVFLANRKLAENSKLVITGMLIGSIFNTVVRGESVDLELILQN